MRTPDASRIRFALSRIRLRLCAGSLSKSLQQPKPKISATPWWFQASLRSKRQWKKLLRTIRRYWRPPSLLSSPKEAARGAQQVAAVAEEAGSAAAQAAAAAKQQARGHELAAAIEEIASLAEDIQRRNG